MSLYKYVAISLYAAGSLLIFRDVYETSQMVIDEEFHLRQGLHYCNGNFTIWDPKITTFPGLYIASAILFLPLQLCNVLTLRLTSLLASVINVWFIYEIRKLALGRKSINDLKTAFEALTISILPPMYFFVHIYYTDILSLTCILGLILFNMQHRHQLAAVFGAFSVLMRQTNIVWVGFALGLTVIDKLVSQTMPFIKDQSHLIGSGGSGGVGGSSSKKGIDGVYGFKEILVVIGFYCRRFYLIPKQVKLLAFYLIGYIVVLLLFIAFLIVNGSIVIGDKSAHEAAVHLPQILYFGLFSALFGSSIILATLIDTMKTMVRRWYLVLASIAAIAIVVHFNTLVHPYLLADNRHYTFIVWNKFYGKYWWARYSMIPVYIYAMIALYLSQANKSAGFKVMFAICAFVAIALQQLIEVRYFIVPFLLLRLNAIELRTRFVLFEFITFIFINYIAFMIFYIKEIQWDDYDAPQRIMW